MDGEYFFDTYALIEFIEGNDSYQKFSDTPIITAFYNLYELVYFLLRDYDEDRVEKVLKKLNPNTIEPDREHLIEAAEFKLKNRDQQLSYVDCMGYVLARDNDLIFLTGDQEFREKKNVEYLD